MDKEQLTDAGAMLELIQFLGDQHNIEALEQAGRRRDTSVRLVLLTNILHFAWKLGICPAPVIVGRA